jgi:putative regulator of septum formation
VRLVIRLVVIALFLSGGFIVRDRITGGAGDLKVGDCFDAKQADVVKELQHHPCNEAHTAEVVLVSDYPSAKGAAYPTLTGFDAWGERTCAIALVTYVRPGTDLEALRYGILYPTSSGWAGGDRGMTCFIGSDAPMTNSLRAAGS